MNPMHSPPPQSRPTDVANNLALRSWVDSANQPSCDFPLNNLPYGIFHTQDQPIRRLGQPEEIARAVVYLAADEAAYITGTTLSVNGGRHMA